jgi:hypothetical protein
MTSLHIGIIGGGFAGLSSAKIFKTFGHSVTLFEKEGDVGGVWSASRRYPGLTTQNVRSTYALSDFPYPKGYPEWPSGEQVQKYLHSYCEKFSLLADIRFNHLVTSATQGEDGRWYVQVTDTHLNQTSDHVFDYLLICNGIFSQPAIPAFDGAKEYIEQGGKIYHTSEFTNIDQAHGKHVAVVGYGKSSCDVAQAVSSVSASTTVVARSLIWKVPKKLFNVLNYKFLLLTRLGEALFEYIRLRGAEAFLHGPGNVIRKSMLGQVQWVITKQCKLNELGLHPQKPFETIARSTVSLVTEGFFENISKGTIKVAKNTSIKHLKMADGKGQAELDNGDTIDADLVICGTGWHQSVPFLEPHINAKINDEQGNFRLYRSMVPVGVTNLAFNGYNSSFFSQLNCEIGALWIADLIAGKLELPNTMRQNQIIDERLAWMQKRTDGKHCKGTNIIPFSIHHIDELLVDMKLTLAPLTRFKQWFMPVNPGDFASATTKLLRRHKGN